MIQLTSLRREFRPMFGLAWPVVLAELGWMGMGLVDTIMVGRLGPEAIGAVGVGSIVFLSIAILGIGVLFGLDTLVSQAYGGGRLEDCHRWLVHGVYLSAILLLPLTAVAWAVALYLDRLGLHPDVEVLTVPYLGIVTLSMLPLLLYAAFRRYLQAMSIVRPVMIALVSANLVNFAANWILIFGRFGAPALGVEGAAWATVISRVYMALVLLVAIVLHARTAETGLFRVSLGFDPGRIRRLVRLGSPAALQLLVEMGVFAAATTLAGRLEPAALAAHQIALNLAGFTYMVPLGISSAGAVRVGQAAGRHDAEAARTSGWTALLLGALFMLGAAIVFVLLPRLLLGLFTADAGVIAVGARLLVVAALFQLFDGVQGVATGVLRGVGDTRTPMLTNLAAHWGFGLPLGSALCFWLDWNVVGLWVGLSAGLILVGVVLLWTWHRRAAGLEGEMWKAPVAWAPVANGGESR